MWPNTERVPFSIIIILTLFTYYNHHSLGTVARTRNKHEHMEKKEFRRQGWNEYWENGGYDDSEGGHRGNGC